MRNRSFSPQTSGLDSVPDFPLSLTHSCCIRAAKESASSGIRSHAGTFNAARATVGNR
ncbi:MAG: hypothetical protein MI923_02645 [Phycisphaerales bacterium]|nr:hypothetical protein [Phycisphaerales bacterium]